MNMTKENSLNQQLSRLILDSVKTGEKLPTEKEMTDKFGVSRATLREALNVYETCGIIVSKQGSGRYAQMPNIGSQIINIWSMFIRENPKLLLELLEIRSILETYTLPKVINKISIEQLQALNFQVNEMNRKVSAGKTFEKNDREFHRILFSCTENKLLEQLLTAFWDLYDDCNISSFRDDLHTLASQHQEILNAIMRKDLDLATQLMKEQFEDAQYQIMVALVK